MEVISVKSDSGRANWIYRDDSHFCELQIQYIIISPNEFEKEKENDNEEILELTNSFRQTIQEIVRDE